MPSEEVVQRGVRPFLLRKRKRKRVEDDEDEEEEVAEKIQQRLRP